MITQPNQNDRKSGDFSYPTNWRVEIFFLVCVTFQQSLLASLRVHHFRALKLHDGHGKNGEFL